MTGAEYIPYRHIKKRFVIPLGVTVHETREIRRTHFKELVINVIERQCFYLEPILLEDDVKLV